MLVDMPLEKLKEYKPDTNRLKDFDKFWEETLKKSNQQPLNSSCKKIDYIVNEVNTYKINYSGFDGANICGFYLTPKSKNQFPVIIDYHGYSGNKGTIFNHLSWVLLGYAVLAIDIRGQSGESIDNKFYPGPSWIGYMTKGIFNKYDYYYRGVYVDCIRALDFLSEREEADIDRLCLCGISQGGGLSLAVSALDSRPKMVISEVPYLCHFKRSVEWAEEAKNITYLEIANLIREYPEKEEDMFNTLSYFDNLNLCEKINCKVIITCAMRDTVCPPSSVYAVYNRIKSEKYIENMPHMIHGSMPYFEEKKLKYIKDYL